jgi:hypothetical protein
MAKQPETQDRFMIHAKDISKDALGEVLLTLARCGVTNVGYEVVTDIHAYQVGTPRNNHSISALDLARQFIAQCHTFRAHELIAKFTQDMRSAAVGYTAMKKLVELGELRKLDAGHYQSTSVKALEPPKAAEPVQEAEEPAEPKARVVNSPGSRYPTSNSLVIWNAIEKRKHITRLEMMQILGDNDRPVSSVDGTISKLREGGKLKSLGDGQYEVIKQRKG